MSATALTQAIARLQRRAMTLAWSAALAWGAFTAIAVLLGWAWMDLLMDAPPAVRMAGIIAAAAGGLLVCAAVVRRAASGWHTGILVRKIDAAAGANGQIVAGFDLSYEKRFLGATELTEGLANLAVIRASRLSAQALPAEAVPARGLKRAALALLAIVAAVGLMGLVAPGLLRSEWSRLTDPSGDHPVYSQLRISVEPGDVKVVYGGDVDIRATVNGGAVDRLETVLVNDAGAEEVVPMFAESTGAWRTSLANVTAAGHYFVRAHAAHTAHFAISVITVPRITSVTARIAPPAYTHLPPFDGAVPSNGISALPETTVEFKVRSNRPLSGGSLLLTGAQAVPLTPVAGGDGMEIRGTFKVKDAGKLTVDVTDIAGQKSTDPFVTTLTLLTDERPFVRIVEPRPQSYATPNATLPVQLIAEDDYGITSLSLLRSLNDSRAIAEDLPVAEQASPRQLGSTVLALKGLGLKPGDVIRLVARAEDNDPAGAKGSESPATTIQIISQDDYNKMMIARAGLEILLSKYEQAQRRMETQEANLRKLKEELAKLPPDSPLAKELREKAQEMAKQAIDDANEVDEAHDLALPFDLDKEMTPRLEDVSNQLRDLASRLAAGTDKAQSVKDESDLIDDLINGVDRTQKKFADETIVPLEYLAKIYPLIADQKKFVQLYQRQNGLAERLAAFPDVVDDPKDKSRLRDMEQEQEHIRQALAGLLDDIANHAAALPEDPRIDSFRQSAQAFSEQVKQSDADDEMSDAESAMADFAGKNAQLEASAAAKALKKFIDEGGGGAGDLGQMAQGALKFQPMLNDNLGDTVAQLLKAGGLGEGGGYSSTGDSGEGTGLYGSMPLGLTSNGNGPSGGLAVGGSVTQPGTPGSGREAVGNARAGSAAAVPVPPQYKRRVDDYFQRVADELQKE